MSTSEETASPLERTKEALASYTEACRDLAIFDAVYVDILKQRAVLERAVNDNLGILKAEARSSEAEVSNRYFEVKVQHKEHRFYDADMLIDLFPEVWNLDGVIAVAADREMTDHFIKIGVIPREIGLECERTEPMTTAISVKTKVKFGKVTKTVKAEIRQKTEK